MSRTRKGAKSLGFEYWGRRGYPTTRMASPGKDAKQATHRQERRVDVQLAKDGQQDDLVDVAHGTHRGMTWRCSRPRVQDEPT